MPSLSLLLPVRNAAGTIESAVQSVLNSTYRNFELVLVNDDSTDTTTAILRRLQGQDSRIRLLDNPRPGLVNAINFGVSQCQAPIIARMDADDICLPHRLERQIHYLNRNPVDGVGGRVIILDDSGQPVPSWKRYESWVNDNLDPDSIAAYRFVESPLVNPTVMVRREVFEIQHRDGPWPEDYEFWLRAMNLGFRFAKVPEVILHWMDRPTRLTRNDPRYSPESFDQCRRLHLLQGPLRHQGTVDLWGGGQTGKPWLRWLLQEGLCVRKIIEVSPRKIGQTMENVAIISPESMGPCDDTPLVVAVGAEGAREQIQQHILPLGYQPGRNTWFVA